jgi:hypothetical protein
MFCVAGAIEYVHAGGGAACVTVKVWTGDGDRTGPKSAGIRGDAERDRPITRSGRPAA